MEVLYCCDIIHGVLRNKRIRFEGKGEISLSLGVQKKCKVLILASNGEEIDHTIFNCFIERQNILTGNIWKHAFKYF